jgi:hypothetical protein
MGLRVVRIVRLWLLVWIGCCFHLAWSGKSGKTAAMRRAAHSDASELVFKAMNSRGYFCQQPQYCDSNTLGMTGVL